MIKTNPYSSSHMHIEMLISILSRHEPVQWLLMTAYCDMWSVLLVHRKGRADRQILTFSQCSETDGWVSATSND